MRKLNYLALAVAGLTLASCSQDDLMGPAQGDGNVNITVRLPEDMTTRALSDGLKAENLHIAVYDADNDNKFLWEDNATFGGAIQTTVSMNLAQGKTYNIAFFAVSDAGEDVYTWNPNPTDGTSPNITVNYGTETDPTYLSAENLKDQYDCFYWLEEIDVNASMGLTKTVTLYRPVAQINWGTSDLGEKSVSDDNAFGPNGSYIVSTLTMENAYTQWSLLGNDVMGDPSTQVIRGLATPAASTESAAWAFPVQPENYEYVAMQYVLAPRVESDVYDMTLNMSNSGAPQGVKVVNANDVVVANAPVQANYRTNIYGTLLSDNMEIIVVKSPDWNTPGYNFELIDGVEYMVIGNKNASKLYRGKGNFILSENTTYESDKALQMVYDMNLNLNGYTLTSEGISPYYDGLVIQGLSAAGTNVKISNGTIAPSSNATVENVSATIVVQGANYPSHLTLDNVTVTGPYPVRMTSANTESTIVINSGRFESSNAEAVMVGANNNSTSAGKVFINGGTFGTPGKTQPYLLNIIDNVRKGKDPRQFIEVYGGTFINFDPANNTAEGDPTNFVADGYKSVAQTVGDDVYYTVVPNSAVVSSDVAAINEAAKAGGDVLITGDLNPTTSQMTGGQFGSNYAAIVQNGGVIDGNGNTLKVPGYSVNGQETFGIYTSGGTIKNLTINGGFRDIYAAEKMTGNLYIENCVLKGAYTLNTAGSNYAPYTLNVSNTQMIGWTSWAAFAGATFTDCEFLIGNVFSGDDAYFNAACRPYITTSFNNVAFPKGWSISLAGLGEGCTVSFNHCTVDGVLLNSANAAELFVEIALPQGKTLNQVATFN